MLIPLAIEMVPRVIGMSAKLYRTTKEMEMRR